MNGILIAIVQWLFNFLWRRAAPLQPEFVLVRADSRVRGSVAIRKLLDGTPFSVWLNYFADERFIWRPRSTRTLATNVGGWAKLQGLVGSPQHLAWSRSRNQ